MNNRRFPSSRPPVRMAVASTVALVLVTAACGSSARPDSSAKEPGAAPSQLVRAKQVARIVDPVTVVAAGDIACPPSSDPSSDSCQQEATAHRVTRIAPDLVLALGDLQYESGTAAEFASYDDSWGAFKSITEPIPGNHEYNSSGAAGYYNYFGLSAPGYRAFNAGSWRIYALNSNCSHIDCDAERTWFRNDLDAHPHKCSAMMTHFPRFSSGSEHGSDESMKPFWRIGYAHHLDVALAGHDHDYERFTALTPGGALAPGRGITSFVSGAGGKSFYDLGPRITGSKFSQDNRFGVLVLTLKDKRYAWEFRTAAGRTLDSGSKPCV
jgi:acid phosphatase type 7